jgi:hypothetical protein
MFGFLFILKVIFESGKQKQFQKRKYYENGPNKRAVLVVVSLTKKN